MEESHDVGCLSAASDGRVSKDEAGPGLKKDGMVMFVLAAPGNCSS